MKTIPAVLALLVWVFPASSDGQVVDDLRRQQAMQRYRNGQELMLAEQFEKAAREFSGAIELDPLLTLAHHGLGQAYMSQKRFASAIQAFIACREAYRLIHGLREKDRVAADRVADDQIRELQDAAQMYRSGRVKGYGGGSGEARATQLEARIADFERTRNLGITSFRPPAEVALALGSAYFRNGNADEAEREWKSAVEVNPKLGEAHNNLAVLFMIRGRKKDAEDAVKAAERAGFRVNPNLKADIRKMPN